MSAGLLAAGAGPVVVVGDVMTDIIVRPEGPIVPGSDRAARIVSRPGGSGANQAVWLAHFGVPTLLAARVGAADVAAQSERFAALGVVPRLAGDVERPTGTLVTLLDPDGERSFLSDRGANTGLCAMDLPDNLLEGAGLLHVSGYALFLPGPRAAVLALVERARARGVPVSLDPGSHGFLAETGPQAFLEWTRGADLFVPNGAEAQILTGLSEPEAQAARLSRSYGLVVLKRGPAGALAARDGDVFDRAEGTPLAAVDATGAGDAFYAGLVAGLRAGEGVAAALERAAEAGAAATQSVGGQPA